MSGQQPPLQEEVYGKAPGARTTWVQDETVLTRIQRSQGFGLSNLPPGYSGEKISCSIFENQRYQKSSKSWSDNMVPEAEDNLKVPKSPGVRNSPKPSPVRAKPSASVRAAYSHRDGTGVYYADRNGHPMVTLPLGWHWVDDWRIVTVGQENGYLSEWEYAADWNSALFMPIENEVKDIRAANGKLVSSGDQVRRRCWQRTMSDSHDQQQQIENSGSSRRVALGDDHFVLLGIEGRVYSLGENGSSQCGVSQTDVSAAQIVQTPFAVPMLRDKVSVKVAAGSRHSMVLLADGSVWSSGDNQFGQTAVDQKLWKSTGSIVSGLQGYSVVSIAVGSNHSLFLTSSGAVLSCGDNSSGQLAQGSGLKMSARPKPIKGDWKGNDSDCCFKSISAGGDCSAAVATSGRVYTWGSAEHGALGRKLSRRSGGITEAKNMPQPSAGLVDMLAKNGVKVSSVATSSERSLFLDIEGLVYATMGGEYLVQPILEYLDMAVVQVAVGRGGRAAVLLDDGTVLSCNSARDEFKKVELQEPAKEVACGLENSLAITVHGVIIAFGQNEAEVMAMPGNTYHGELKEEADDVYTQVRSGNGELHALDGSIYTGQFSQNQPHGRGQLTTADGDHYSGTWRHGHRTSLKVKFKNGDEYSGPFKGFVPNGYGYWQSACGDTYVGEFDDSKFHGYGTQTLIDGEIYDGEMDAGRRHGFGICTWPYADGTGIKTKYQGEWCHNQIEGYGVMTSESTGVYTGWFERGERHGHGTMSWKKGEHAGCFYDGDWKEGAMHGHGMYIGADGSVFEGGFYCGKRYQQGCLADASGKLYTVEYGMDHELIEQNTHNSAILHLESLKKEKEQCETDLVDAKQTEQECIAELNSAHNEGAAAEAQKQQDDEELRLATEESTRHDTMLGVISKQVNTANCARSTQVLQLQGQYETFSLSSMDHEAANLQVEIFELQTKHAEEKEVEEQRLKYATDAYDEAMKKLQASRLKKDRSSKASQKLTAVSDFANKRLQGSRAALKRLNEVNARMEISVRIAEHWRNQEVSELKAKVSERAEKTAAEHFKKAEERFAKTSQGVHDREALFFAKKLKLDRATERLKEAEKEAQLAESEAERIHKISVTELKAESEAQSAHARLIAEEKAEMLHSREEQLVTVQLKVERAKLAWEKAQSTSATAQGRLRAVQMLVDKHKAAQQESRLAMQHDQEAERSLRAELQALEAIELTQLVPIEPLPKEVHSTPVAKSSHWAVVQNVTKFLSRAKHSSKNDPHKLAEPDQRDALSEVCEHELAAMHLSLEDPVPEDADQDVVDRWTLKYKYKYMYKYRARDMAAALNTKASSMLGPVWDPIDPAVHSPPTSPMKGHDSDMQPMPSSPSWKEGAILDLAVSVRADGDSVNDMDLQQVEAVHKRALKQVERLVKEANLLPLTRKQERAELTPLIRDRRCEATGWGQVMAAMQTVGEEDVRCALEEKGEPLLWSGNVAWIAQWLVQSLNVNDAETQARVSLSPTGPTWNTAFTKDSQDAFDRRMKALEETRAKAQQGETHRLVSPPHTAQNNPPSPDLSAFSRLLAQEQSKPSASKTPKRCVQPKPLSPGDKDRQRLLTTYYEAKDIEPTFAW